MKIDVKLIMIVALIAVVVVLIVHKGCGNGKNDVQEIKIELLYDSLKRDIVSKLPPPDTIDRITEKTVVKWLPSATVRDTIYVYGETVYIYNDAEIDTNAILTHYLTQAVTYTDTIEDRALQAVIRDVIFRNHIRERDFSYKWKKPVEDNSKWYLDVGDGEGLTEEELQRCVDELPNGAFYRRTDQLDENGNYYLEVSESIILADGTVVDSSNYQLGDGVDGWHWYVDGETVTIASPSAWEKIKNFFNIG